MTTYKLSKRRNANGEYVIRTYVDGKHCPASDYFTTDLTDAKQTLACLDGTLPVTQHGGARIRSYVVAISHPTNYHSGHHAVTVHETAGSNVVTYNGKPMRNLFVTGNGFGCSRDYFVSCDREAITQFLAEHACTVNAVSYLS
jgi:hypothetical protein